MKQLQKYKKTELGDIPEEWNIYKGDEIFVISSGVSPTDVTFENNEDVDTLYVKVDDMNLPINSKYIKESKLKFRYDSNLKIPVFEANSIIFPKRGAAILTNKVRIVEKRCTVDPNIMVLNCKKLLLPDFLYHHLVHLKLFNIMENAGLPQLNNKDLYPKKFVIPPINEQQKIASILSNVDLLIQKTDQIIGHTKILKKGLMQRLLTKGIGHTKFKEVSIGPRYVVLNIPLSWKIATLDSLVSQSISYGVLVPEEDPNGVPMIRSGEIGIPGGIERNVMTINKTLEEKYKKTRLNGGEILMALVGATIGKLTVAPDWCKGYNVSRAIAVIRLHKDYIPKFFAYFLKTDLIQKKIRIMTSGSAQPVINLEEISKFKVIVPSSQEQNMIVSILDNIEDQILLNQKCRLLLLRQKKGLMQQLLTGKIRVKV